MKQKRIIIGNWKMAPKSIREARAVFQNIRNIASKLQHVQTVVCVPHVFLSELKKLVTGHRCVIGAQNVSSERDDPHTGEVSVDMVKETGAQYVIVGHSECRAKGETDEEVAQKAGLITKDLIAVVCVGESERDDEGRYTIFVKKQLLASLGKVTRKNLNNVVVAYEPVWAIGSKAKKEATLEDIQEMTIFIRKVLVDAFGGKKGNDIAILYGGSVNPTNATLYLRGTDIKGFLVGRVSLKPAGFEKILKATNE